LIKQAETRLQFGFPLRSRQT